MCGRGKEECLCKNYRFFYSGLAAPFYYEGSVSKCIRNFKFRGKTQNASFLAKAMANTVNIQFANCVQENMLTYDYINVMVLVHDDYVINPIKNELGTIGAEIKIFNRYDYSKKDIVISKAIKSAVEPFLEIGTDYNYSFMPVKLLEVSNKICKIENGALTAKADITNHSENAQSYYAIVGVYGANNEMVYSYVKNGTLGKNESVNIDKQIALTLVGNCNAKFFIWNDENTMKTIFQ